MNMTCMSTLLLLLLLLLLKTGADAAVSFSDWRLAVQRRFSLSASKLLKLGNILVRLMYA